MTIGCKLMLCTVALALLRAGSVWGVCPAGDLNGDCRVDAEDMQILGQQWLAPPESLADLDGDDRVDLNDFTRIAADWRHRGIPLSINEVLASNMASVADPQGGYDDWIEIYNGGQESINCGGMYVTDDVSDPTKWSLPRRNPALTTVPAKGYLLIWADGDVAGSGLHAGFRLDAGGDEVALFDSDGVTLIDHVAFDEQETDVSYGRLPDGAEAWRLFDVPTPGAQNAAVYDGFVAAPSFSPERGFYEDQILVTLSTETPGATIYYTVDGEEPYLRTGRFPKGGIYSGLIPIVQTICLRARAVKPGWKPSAIRTHTYLFLRDVVTQSWGGSPPGPDWPSSNVSGQAINYGMDPEVTQDPRYNDLMDDALLAIPSISLVTRLPNLFDAQTGIYVHARSQGRSWERPVSVELLDPAGEDGFQVDGGLRIRGGFSRTGGNPKHAFRLFFRPEYGPSRLALPLFEDEGTGEFENVDLRTSQNYSWSFQGDRQNTMVREVFSRDLQGEMGHPYTRSRYYHLYLNGEYWGLFQTQERSEASYAESYFGGAKEDYDVVKSESGSYSMTTTDGNLDAYRRLYDAARAGLSTNERYYQIQGLNADGTPNPNYERLLDPDNLIDFMIIDYYTGDRDGPGSRFVNRPNNTYGIYNRENPDGWKWFHHDNEHTLGVSASERNLVTPFTSAGAQWRYFNPHWLHERLANSNADYRMHFADHVYRHFFNGGLLTPDVSIARIQKRAQQIDLAIIAESARWGDAQRSRPYTRQDWLSEVSRIVNDYLPTRTQVVLDQFKSVGWYPQIDPPAFNQQGGHVARGFILRLSGMGGEIYYTLDGSDPRRPGGSVNTGHAQRYSSAVRLTASVRVKARQLIGNLWSALNEAVFAVGPVAESLRISEIMYHPADPNAEYVELTNIGDAAVNVSLVQFTDGISCTVGDFELAPGQYGLLVKDVAAFEACYGPDVPVMGHYAGSLSNAGEQLELRDAAGTVIHRFRYRDNWYAITDGDGFSLTVRNAGMTDVNGLNGKQAWRPSAAAGGSPGTNDNNQVPTLGSVVINELLAGSAAGAADWIELHNTSFRPIDIGGWFLSDDRDDLTRYEIAPGTQIPAKGYLVFHEDLHFGNENDPGCRRPFALRRSGETVYLHSGANGTLTGYSEQAKFDASDPDVSVGRYQKSTGIWDFVALAEPTPGRENAAPQIGPVVINEIMYHPAAPGDAEYVELLNSSGAPVTLYDDAGQAPWRFTDDPDNPGIAFLFATDEPVTLAPGAYLVLARDVTLLRASFNVPANVTVLAWGAGRLANGSEPVQLSRPAQTGPGEDRVWVRVDRVVYSDGAHPEDLPELRDPWPVEPDGQGSSLSRTSPQAYGDDAGSWRSAAPTPGSANF